MSARERIMAAFIAMLEKPHPSVKGMALIPQLAKYIDGHFRYICSFYDRKELLKNLESGTKYYLSFLSRSTEIERIPVSEITKAAVSAGNSARVSFSFGGINYGLELRRIDS